MTIMKKAVSADIAIPIKPQTTCPPSRLLVNGIQVASFQANEAIYGLAQLLDDMETLAGYRHAGFWTKADAVRYPEEDPTIEQQTWIYHFYDSAPF